MTERQKALLGLKNDYSEGIRVESPKSTSKTHKSTHSSPSSFRGSKNYNLSPSKGSPHSAALYFNSPSSPNRASPSKYTPQKNKEVESSGMNVEYTPSSFLLVDCHNYKASSSKFVAIPDVKPVEAKAALSVISFESSVKQLAIVSMERSVEKLREWIASKIIHPLIKDIDELDKKFSELGNLNFQCKNSGWMQSNSN